MPTWFPNIFRLQGLTARHVRPNTDKHICTESNFDKKYVTIFWLRCISFPLVERNQNSIKKKNIKLHKAMQVFHSFNWFYTAQECEIIEYLIRIRMINCKYCPRAVIFVNYHFVKCFTLVEKHKALLNVTPKLFRVYVFYIFLLFLVQFPAIA